MMKDDVLIYGLLNQPSHTVFHPGDLLSHHTVVVRLVCCLFPKSTAAYLVAAGNIGSSCFVFFLAGDGNRFREYTVKRSIHQDLRDLKNPHLMYVQGER